MMHGLEIYLIKRKGELLRDTVWGILSAERWMSGFPVACVKNQGRMFDIA